MGECVINLLDGDKISSHEIYEYELEFDTWQMV